MTKIEWVKDQDGRQGVTWNPITGCTKCSPGCQNCYAETMARRLKAMGAPGYENGFAVTLHPERLAEPLKWRKPRTVFVCSMGDLFHGSVPDEYIADVFNVMACATVDCGKRHEHSEECWTGEPHTFQLLTKRPERALKVMTEMVNYVANHWPGDAPLSVAMEAGAWPLPNVHLGVTVCNQQEADEKIPLLLQIPAAVRFVSIEPMLGPVDLTRIPWNTGTINALTGAITDPETGMVYGANHRMFPHLHQVICGGETGHGARPMHPDWARSLRDQCKEAGTAFFFKSWGDWAPADQFPIISCSGFPKWRTTFTRRDGTTFTTMDPKRADEYKTRMYRVGKKAAGRFLDGVEHSELPGQEVAG